MFLKLLLPLSPGFPARPSLGQRICLLYPAIRRVYDHNIFCKYDDPQRNVTSKRYLVTKENGTAERTEPWGTPILSSVTSLKTF